MSDYEQKQLQQAVIQLKRLVSIGQEVTKYLASIDRSLSNGDLQDELRDFRSDFRPELKRSHAVRQKLEKAEKRKAALARVFEKSTVTTG